LHRKPRDEKRLGPYQIARILNEEGWPTCDADQWYGSHVNAILKHLKHGVREHGIVSSNRCV